MEGAKKAETEIVYVVRHPNDDRRWETVDRSVFARADRDAVCGTNSEVIQAIAAREGVRDCCIQKSRGYGKNEYDLDFTNHTFGHLHALEYVKTTGKAIRDIYFFSRAQIAELLCRKRSQGVENVGYRSFVIDRKFVAANGELYYDPVKAVELIEGAKSTPDSPHAQEIQTNIPMRWVLMPLWEELARTLYEHPALKLTYRTGGWHRRHPLKIGDPRRRDDYIDALPILYEVQQKLVGGTGYRNERWEAAIKLLYEKHMNDKRMSTQFAEIIRKEAKAMKTKKGKL